MTQNELNTVAAQLERAAEILRSDVTTSEKINTLVKIGDICSFQGKKWGDEEFDKLLESLIYSTEEE